MIINTHKQCSLVAAYCRATTCGDVPQGECHGHPRQQAWDWVVCSRTSQFGSKMTKPFGETLALGLGVASLLGFEACVGVQGLALVFFIGVFSSLSGPVTVSTSTSLLSCGRYLVPVKLARMPATKSAKTSSQRTVAKLSAPFIRAVKVTAKSCCMLSGGPKQPTTTLHSYRRAARMCASKRASGVATKIKCKSSVISLEKR